jgi:hypothetical protein
MMTKQKVMIGYPTGGSVHPAFTKSLVDLVHFEDTSPDDNYELSWVEYSASLYVQENRNILVTKARMMGADWLLQIDTDESFEFHVLRQLMKTADKDKRPIVFGLYSNVSQAPAQAEGSFLVIDMIYRETEKGDYESIVPPTDLRPFRVDAAGTGMMLTHMSVYDKIAKPWFELCYIWVAGQDDPQVMNEDIAFCRLAREAGYQLWCDPLAEARHHKTIALLPSTFRHFMERAKQVESEMRNLG